MGLAFAKHYARVFMLEMALLVGWMGVVAAQGFRASGERPPLQLLEPASIDPLESSTSLGANPSFLRRRLVRVAPEIFQPEALRSPIVVDLFDRTVELAFEAIEMRGTAAFTASGSLEGGGFFILVVQDETLSGRIQPARGPPIYIQSLGEGLHALAQHDDSRGESCGVGSSDDSGSSNLDRAPTSVSPLADDGSVIEISVVYTSAALQTAGGLSSLLGSLELGRASANFAFEGSGVATRIRFVNIAEIAYTESGSVCTDVERLGNASNGLEVAEALRNQSCADFSLLVVDDVDPLFGGCANTLRAPLLPPFDFAQLAAAVVQVDRVRSLALAHEVGHVLGAEHDRTNACGTGVCTGTCCPGDATRELRRGSYDHSYGTRVLDGWRTVMSEFAGCSSCPAIPLFSNPALTYEGAPVGVSGGHPSGANNALTLNLNRSIAANWRASCTPPEDLGLSPPAVPGDLLVTSRGSFELLRVDTDGNRGVLSSSQVGSGPPVTGVRAVTVTSDRQILVIQIPPRVVLRIDPQTGERTALSGCTALDCSTIIGDGPEFQSPLRLASASHGGAFLSDGFGVLLRIDGASGDRTILSGCVDPDCTSQVGAGPAIFPGGVVVESATSLLTVDLRAVVRVDLPSGDRSIVSGCLDSDCTASRGVGLAFEFAEDLVIEADGNILVSDLGLNSLIRVDPASGDRAVLSGCEQLACNSTSGTGTALAAPEGLALEADRSVLVVDRVLGAVLRVHPESGNRAIVSGCADTACTSLVGAGPPIRRPDDIARLPEPFAAPFAATALIALLAGLRLRQRESR